MRKLSEIRGEDALDILSDILEPASEFITDDEFVKLIKKDNKVTAVAYALKNHKKAVITIMAILEGENPTTYKPPLLKLPVMLLEILNDPELMVLFPSEQTVTSSGSATESTEETEEE